MIFKYQKYSYSSKGVPFPVFFRKPMKQKKHNKLKMINMLILNVLLSLILVEVIIITRRRRG